jgi:hypothetical protein
MPPKMRLGFNPLKELNQRSLKSPANPALADGTPIA